MSYPKQAIDEAFELLSRDMDTPNARVILAAIGYQESDGYATRRQYGNGPAAGYWQFERGGIKGVMRHESSSLLARKACHARGIPFDADNIWQAFQADDVLAAVFARLLMWTDPKPLPTTPQGAWEMYANRLWRPGKPHASKWGKSWAFGLENA